MSGTVEADSESMLDWAKLRCRREALAYNAWLGKLTPWRWFCVSGGIVFSAAAGVSIVWQALPHGRVISALLAFAASALTGLHVALKCEVHQTECRRLIQAFRSLEIQMNACNVLPPPGRDERQQALVEDLAQLIKTTAACPSDKCYELADKSLAKGRPGIAAT
jgi:hypothetical protein